MAASDPTTDVPTPTGTLQGVAAFSWDGSAWQPTGRAGPSVATPTGVLQGVAPFSWDGANWQPSGRAQPGVATASGVLDGVAVYTWSGAAWTPAGGQPTPSTPTGALRGVAAFNWDGTNWQPTGQAGPSVATPYGALAGVAMFNWTGSAWAAVQGPSLDISFLTPGALDARLTFTRGSIATYFDGTGTMQTVAGNTPRWDYDPVSHALRGLLFEETRTNIALNSANFTAGGWSAVAVTLTTGQPGAPDGTAALTSVAETTAASAHYLGQTYAGLTASTPYTLSLYARAAGTRYLQLAFSDGGVNGGYATFDLQAGVISGPLTAMGAAVIGTASMQAVGGGTYRCSITTSPGVTGPNVWIFLSNVPAFTWAPSYAGNASNGLLIWGAQLEPGASPTSYIATTGVAATRAADICSTPLASWFNPAAISVAADVIMLNAGSSGFGGLYAITDGPNTNRLEQDVAQATRNVSSVVTAGGANSVVRPESVPITYGVPFKIGATLVSGAFASSLNGAVPYSNTTGIVMPTGMNSLSIGNLGGLNVMCGYMRRLRYWPRSLSAAELQSVTT